MNVFEKHGISGLSASTINSWTDQPALTLLKIAGITNDPSPAMWRGTASEHAINIASQSHDYDMQSLVSAAEQKFDELYAGSGVDVSAEKLEKEKSGIEKYVTNGVEYLAEFMGDVVEPPLLQGRIEFMVDELPVPIVGYYDMLFKQPHSVVDIKTSAIRPRNPSFAHARQVSVYWAGTGAEPWIWYVAKNGVSAFNVDKPQSFFNQFVMAAKSLERVLSYSDDIFECCQLVYPDVDHWKWGDQTRAAARDIWKMEV